MMEPPADYEDLIRIIHERYDGMSKTHQRIGEYLTQNPNDVAVMSVNAIADTCGIHASSFVRFAQSLGYSGFKDLQTLFQKRLSTAAPGFAARLRALEAELTRDQGDKQSNILGELVVRDVASLQDLMTSTPPDQIDKAVRMMDKAQTIYLIGQLRSSPLVFLLHYVLTMIGKPCVLLDEAGGLATHRAKLITKKDLLFAVSFRFYATEVVTITEETKKRDVPILAITDSTLSPLAKSADLIFSIPEHAYTFSRSLAAPMCLAQALAVALAARMQRDSDPRIPTVTQP
jgi:DNA-binding MurR/RpiR family transcriptional regulator